VTGIYDIAQQLAANSLFQRWNDLTYYCLASTGYSLVSTGYFLALTGYFPASTGYFLRAIHPHFLETRWLLPVLRCVHSLLETPHLSIPLLIRFFPS